MATLIELSDLQLIDASGADAEKYLQGQLTCDVAKLPIGESTLTAHCDPKGKMSAIFRLIRVADTRFLILIAQDLLPSALDALKKYAVFSKITFMPLAWQIVGVLGENKMAADITLELSENRHLLFNEQAQNLPLNGELAQWHSAEIRAGIPQLFAATQNEFIPQALNLQAIERAISFSKGCYIGQETVARAKYRGANKRAMFIFHAKTDALPAIGEAIEMQLDSGWRKTGTIVRVANDNGELMLLVVMNNDIDENQLFRLLINQMELHILPLPYLLNEN